ncbi:MAG: M23 family metallopeptidase [Saprospiraceae bacterium]|nr:M23 family metallopeptidase [Saprospiraceae bacterium]
MKSRWRFAIFIFGVLPLLWSFYDRNQAAPVPVSTQSIDPEPYPKDYFMPPVTGPVRLTGTCGELRPDHFHAGIDIDGYTGNPVFAAAEGFVDRIKVSATGYGNVLYVKHPNGYTTVYAHLDRFASDIQKYVKENQYRTESFEVELNPPNSMFKVKKGQEIAKLGNTGSSGGPHLHFEIRNPAGKTINPLLFNIPVADNIAPELRDMKIYFLNDKREVLGSKAFPLLKDKTGHIGLESDTVMVGGWRVGFGVKTYDKSNGRRNDNGVYSVALLADDQPAFEWRAEAFDFDETRYLNAHIDYATKRRYGAWFHRCFVMPGDNLSNYTPTPSMGAIQLYKDKPVKIQIKIADAAGNSFSLIFWVLRDENAMETFISAPYQFQIPYDADTRIDLDGFSMAMEKGSVYETLGFQYSTSTDQNGDAFSITHHLHNNRTPVHKYFDLSIRPNNIPAHLRNKAVIANCDDGKPDNCGGAWQGEFLKTRVRSFGDYCVMVDTVPPSIKPVVFSPDMRKKSNLSFKISDNFAVSGTANGMRYRGTIDGKWVLFEYDKKRARLTYEFDEHIGAGEHLLSLKVTDDRGNESVFERKFLR